jgi:integrase/recombinase XerD
MGKRVWFPVVSGPLAPYAAGFELWLRSGSYSPSAVANRLCQLDQISRWLERRGLTADELTEARAAEFTSSRRETGLVTWTSPQSVALPLEYLRELGVLPAPAPSAGDGPLDELLAAYRRYLLVERGLSEHTVGDAYVPAARLFLEGREGADGLGWSGCRRRT